MPRTSVGHAMTDSPGFASKRRRGARDASSPVPSNYPEDKIAIMKEAIRTVLACVGEDVNREGLLDTPKRVAKAWMDVSIGYRQDTVSMLGVTSDRPGGAFFSDGTVAQGANGIVVVRDIDFASTNAATLLPFHGRCHIGYVPSAGVVLGLSKLARLTKHFGKRLQSQSKMATDIASSLQTHLQCQGIAVLIEARQLAPLGVEASRKEACIGGCFADDDYQFQEFLALLDMTAPSLSNVHILSSSKNCTPEHTHWAMSPDASEVSSKAGNCLRAIPSFSSEDSSSEADSRRSLIPECLDENSPAALKMETAINSMIRQIGEDPESESLRKSAMCYASGLLASTRGYTAQLPSRNEAFVARDAADIALSQASLTAGDTLSTVDVATASFIFNSQCEHHMLPFYGRVMLAYIPARGSKELLSRSALEQVVRVYTNRLQVQERITHQLADAIAELAVPEGVMVVCQAAHMCMLARGVENHSGATSTFAVRGVFEGSPDMRRHVLAAFNAKSQ